MCARRHTLFLLPFICRRSRRCMRKSNRDLSRSGGPLHSGGKSTSVFPLLFFFFSCAGLDECYAVVRDPHAGVTGTTFSASAFFDARALYDPQPKVPATIRSPLFTGRSNLDWAHTRGCGENPKQFFSHHSPHKILRMKNMVMAHFQPGVPTTTRRCVRVCTRA